MNLLEAGPSSAAVEGSARSMIDVTFRMKANDIFGELLFPGFNDHIKKQISPSQLI